MLYLERSRLENIGCASSRQRLVLTQQQAKISSLHIFRKTTDFTNTSNRRRLEKKLQVSYDEYSCLSDLADL